VKITVAKDHKTDGDRVTVGSEIIADADYRFAMDYDASWLSNDALELKTSNGLLTSIWSKVEDRTYEVAINLARSFGAVQGFTVPADGRSSKTPVCNKPVLPENAYRKLLIDPYSQEDRDAYPWVRIDDFGKSVAKPKMVSAEQLKRCARGVCTRTVRPWRVRVTLACDVKDGQAQYTYRDEVVYLPDERDVVPVDLKRAFMVEKRYYALFNQGLLTEVRLSKPSSAEELAKLPEGILRALVSVPTELVQLRYNYNVQRKDLTASELERLKQRDALRTYQASSTQPPAPAPSGGGGAPTSEGAGEGPTPPKPVPPQPDSPPSPSGVDAPPAVPDTPPPPPVSPSPESDPDNE